MEDKRTRRMKELGVTEEDIHETNFPPDPHVIPIRRGRDADRRFHSMRRRAAEEQKRIRVNKKKPELER